MNNKIQLQNILSCVLIFISIVGCSGNISTQKLPSTTTNSSIIESTQTVEPTLKPKILDIMIDGKNDDWQNFPSESVVDESEDNIPGSPDIGEVRAFNSDEDFLFSLITLWTLVLFSLILLFIHKLIL